MRRILLTTSALVIACATTSFAQTRLAVRPESKLLLEGDSNLHGWHCSAATFETVVSMDTAAKSPFVAALKQVEVKIPVANLKCGNGGLEKNLAKAVKADVAPVIRYVMTGFDVVPSDGASSFTLKTTGTLSIAGAEKPVTMDVVATRAADGAIRATGEVALLMTDFGIKPPTAMLGTLKTKDKVEVKFELLVGPAIVTAPMGGSPQR